MHDGYFRMDNLGEGTDYVKSIRNNCDAYA